MNNAGILHAKPFLDFKASEIKKQIEVNVYSQIFMLQEFLPELLDRDHGHVVSMCSMAGVQGTPYMTTYCASKFAVKGIMDALFLELRQDRPKSKVHKSVRCMTQ